MKECNAKAVGNEPASALETLRQSPADCQYPAYIGLDVHKETIVVAVAVVVFVLLESRGSSCTISSPRTIGVSANPAYPARAWVQAASVDR